MAQNTVTTKLLLDTSQFNAAMTKSASKTQAFGQKMFRVGRDLSAALTLPLALAAKNVLDTASSFELAQTKIAALSGSKKIFSDLSESARELGANTIFTATEISTLQLNLKKLGKSRGEILALQESVLNFAQAMDTDLAEAGSFVVQTLNRFSESLERVGDTAEQAAYVTDLFAAASANTAVDAEKLRAALNYVGSEAAAAGFDLEQTTAIIGLLADRGFDASRGGTALRRILAQLAKEGLSAEESISALFDSTKSYSEELKSFGLRGAGPKAALGGLREEYAQLLDILQNSQGFLGDVADSLDTTLYASLRKVTSAAQELSLSIAGDVLSPLKNFLALVADSIRKFAKAPPIVKKVVIGFGSFLAILGPIALGVGALTLAFGALSSVLLSNPLFAALAGIIALGGALASTAYDAETLRKSMNISRKAVEDYANVSEEAIKKSRLQGDEIKRSEQLLKRRAVTLRQIQNLEQSLASFQIADSQADRDPSENTIKTEKSLARARDILKEQNSELDTLLEKTRKIQDAIDKQQAARTSSFFGFVPSEELDSDKEAKKLQKIKDEQARWEAFKKANEELQRQYDYRRSLIDEYDDDEVSRRSTFGERMTEAESAVDAITSDWEDFVDNDALDDWDFMTEEKANETVSRFERIKEAIKDNARVIRDFAEAIGNTLSRTITDAAFGVKSLADSIKDNLIGALQQLITKIIALTIAWGILTIISGGTSALAGLAGSALSTAGGGSLTGFIGNGFGLQNAKSQQVTVNGSLNGGDLILSNQRAGSALDRIYG